MTLTKIAWSRSLVATANQTVRNAFCPTGEGGGIDNSCPPGRSAVHSDEAPAADMLSSLKATGGFTYVAAQQKYQRIGETGYAVSPYPTRSVVIDGKVTRDDIRDYMRKNADVLGKPGHALGAWRDPASGKTYLDISIVTEDKDDAIRLGKEHDQIAIFDFKSGSTIDTGGTGGVKANTGRLTRNASYVDRSRRHRRRNRRRLKSTRRRRILDPTRTTSLRAAFARDLRQKFARIKGELYQWLVTDDTLGLAMPVLGFNARREFAFVTSPTKLAEFQRWLRLRFDREFKSKSSQELWRRYVQDGFRRGHGRAFDDVRAGQTAAAKKSSDWQAGAREEFLRSSFGQPVAVEKVQLLASRSFADLQNMTEDVATKMGRVLADGLVRGAAPREVARDLDEVLDLGRARSELIARTEIIRAHAEGQLDAFDRLGIQELGVQVEWSTAGDDRVCPACADMEGKIFSVDEAHGLIPLHPHCRCAFLPAGEPIEPEKRSLTTNRVRLTVAAFCPTGEGGGIDNSCPPENKGSGGAAPAPAPKQRKFGTNPELKIKEAVRALPGGKAMIQQFNKLKVERALLNKAANRDGAGDLTKQKARDAKDQLAALRARMKALGEGKKIEDKVEERQQLKMKEAPIQDRRKLEPLPRFEEAEPVPKKAREPAKPAEPSERVPKSPDPVASKMQTAKVVAKKNQGGGANKTEKVTLEDGSKGLWKPIEGEMEGLRDGVPAGEYYRREAAAYEVARAVGTDDLMPRVVVREIDGELGSLQEWVDDATDAVNNWGNQYDGEKDAARAAAFDVLIGNTDRHNGNWLIQGPDEERNRPGMGKIRLIDHGLAFPTGTGEFRSFITDHVSSRGLKVPAEVKSWDGDKVAAVMRKYGIAEKAVSLMYKRLSYLQTLDTFPPYNFKRELARAQG